MPKIKYNQKVEFAINNSDPSAQDDSNECETEEHKYGIYFNDGYDYMKHLVSMDDFLNMSKDLKDREVVAKKPNPTNLLSKPKATATVIKEFEVFEEGFQDNTCKKLKEITNGEIDEDFLNALNSDAELSDLEDDFVDMANGAAATRNIKGDAQLFNRFLGNFDDNETDDYGGANVKDVFSFSNNISRPINEIAAGINFDNNFDQISMGDMSYYAGKGKSVGISLALLNAFEREQDKAQTKSSVFGTVDPDILQYNRSLNLGETEYDEDEINRAVDDWLGEKKEPQRKKLGVSGKLCKAGLTYVDIPKWDRARPAEKMERDEPLPENAVVEITNVAQFHVPRGNESRDEKRDRKRAIKAAKRSRTEEKKISRQTFNVAKRMRSS